MRLLFLSLSGIGNYIMQSPVFAAIKKAHPDWHITVWVAPRGTRTLAENDPHVDEVIESSIKLPPTAHARLVWRLARARYNAAIMLSPGQLWKGAAYMFLSGAKERLAHEYPFRGNPKSRFLLTRSIPENPQLHDVEQNLNLLGLLGIKSVRVTNYELRVTPLHTQKAQEILTNLGIYGQATLIGLHPGSAPCFNWKRWPAGRFAALAQTLAEKGNYHFLIFGGPEEKELKEKLQQLINEKIPSHLASVVSADLLTTAATIQRCNLFLSNDSGLMHIAAAVGVRTLGLFGPTDEQQTGPRGPQSFVLRAPNTKPIYHTETNFQPAQATPESLLAITPQMVLDKIAIIGV